MAVGRLERLADPLRRRATCAPPSGSTIFWWRKSTWRGFRPPTTIPRRCWRCSATEGTSPFKVHDNDALLGAGPLGTQRPVPVASCPHQGALRCKPNMLEVPCDRQPSGRHGPFLRGPSLGWGSPGAGVDCHSVLTALLKCTRQRPVAVASPFRTSGKVICGQVRHAELVRSYRPPPYGPPGRCRLRCHPTSRACPACPFGDRGPQACARGEAFRHVGRGGPGSCR